MVERKSKRSHGTELYLNGYEGHLSLVTDPDLLRYLFCAETVCSASPDWPASS